MPTDLLAKPPASPAIAPPETRTLTLDLPPRASRRSTPGHAAQGLFAGSLLELSDTRPAHATRRIVVSVLMHIAVVTVVLLVPLYFTDAIDLSRFTQTSLIAPPPPPPPPPPPSHAIARAAAPRHVFTSQGRLLAPTAIPHQVAMLKEAPLQPDLGGSGEGVIGGVPGGQLGGVIGGVLSGVHANLPPPIVTAAAPKKPVRVGGRIKPPRLLERIAPIYPVLAKQTHVQGVVQIDAVIDAQGNVVEVQAVSGHPLLVPAALRAVSQWKFEPTYLNEEPIPVQFTVTVTFQLE